MWQYYVVADLIKLVNCDYHFDFLMGTSEMQHYQWRQLFLMFLTSFALSGINTLYTIFLKYSHNQKV